jgi:hypothetical protein
MQCEFKQGSHWKQLGIATIDELKFRIKAIFSRHDRQEDVLIGLYQMVFPDWDQIKLIHGHPTAGEDLWIFICSQFQEFDRIHHPACVPGGAWVNFGFSVSKDQSPWEIVFDNCTIEYVG